MAAREHRVRTPDGRTLRVVDDGVPDGLPVVVHHGTPASATLFPPHVEDARTRGLRLLAYDRPGYGGSTPGPGRSVADGARDVAAIADALGLERLATWGSSGGAPHALACAALLGNRLAGAASLSAPAPYGAEGLDWTEGMGADNVEETEAALRGRDALARFLERQAEAIAEGDVDAMIETFRTLLAPVDAAVLSGDLGAFLLHATRVGLQHGLDGWIDDDLAFVAPWGFELERIDRPVLLWHGEHDRFVPVSHGRWLAEQLPQAGARISSDEGHLTLFAARVGEVHEWLAERLRLQPATARTFR